MISPDLSDLLGLIVAVWLLGAVAFVAVRAMMLVLTLQTRKPKHLIAVSVLAVLVLAYVLMYASDIPGVVAILNNHEQDIPPLSILRSAIFDGILSLTGYLLRVLARGSIK
jgi:hypothetical protein